ncbi:aminotransferase class V-fold PLP-dependent enzyme [Cytobacillus sp. NCCP-133]|uniref:aminotransferase class V-fold PLP-dependent enzyme n=1 Tax=Cytobacillus sp. NCCP-133 TaxID=766848 RepID=UPI00222F631A|nr:aminotransferase class V-fold PLP-dependent enzyme [Cytobacillus sp. NCCP-133]GLB60108.1 acetyltransferase [Cytobacillus sp. NCCP-133]
MKSIIYKIACEPDELRQIHELNYQTFVEEIPQHKGNPEQQLIDKFHDENTYVIAKAGEKVIGMIAIRAKRPFSLDYKLENLEDYLPIKGAACEVRLLSVKKEYRSTRVFYQLCEKLVAYCLEKNYTMALISGTVRQLKLYKRMGFLPFGPLTGAEDAQFQPMYLTKENFERSTKAFERLMAKNSEPVKSHSFLPGPVPIHPKVKAAFSKDAISHRSDECINGLKNLRSRLCEMTGAAFAEVVVGTGTLANDLVAAQLKGDGLILANGEFGYRLIDHAKRFQLPFQTIEKEWNEPIDLYEVQHEIRKNPLIKWIWTVHCETSTGYLYDINAIQDLCEQNGIELCVDACSTAGIVPLNLKNIYFASTVSGKGLGSYPGLAIVFHREKIKQNDAVPRYLDLKMYENCESIPYTHSSNLISALDESINLVDFEKTKMLAEKSRRKLNEFGFDLLGESSYSPGILTIQLPMNLSSREFGDQCKQKGILLSYESGYLLERNWIQAALMGEQGEEEVMRGLDMMGEILAKKKEKRYEYV